MGAKRILVTGGAGFVGSHLCERLLADGHSVTALDDLSTGSYANIAHFVKSPRFAFIQHDVAEPFTVACDQIYNLASPASPVHYQRDPVRTTVTNVFGSLYGLRLAAKCGATFLQASTSEVYGDPEVHPQVEAYQGNVNPIGIRSCYDEGKRCAESLVMDFCRHQGVRVRLARIFNTYGPRMAIDDGRVVSNFIVQALRQEDITVHGDGSQTRSFCYVDDLLDGLIALMNHPEHVGPVNLGNPGEFTVMELAREVIRLTQSRSRLAFRPLPADDPRQRRPDIARAKRYLGFEPRTDLKEGLARTIESFRQVLFGVGRRAETPMALSAQ